MKITKNVSFYNIAHCATWTIFFHLMLLHKLLHKKIRRNSTDSTMVLSTLDYRGHGKLGFCSGFGSESIENWIFLPIFLKHLRHFFKSKKLRVPWVRFPLNANIFSKDFFSYFFKWNKNLYNRNTFPFVLSQNTKNKKRHRDSNLWQWRYNIRSLTL